MVAGGTQQMIIDRLENADAYRGLGPRIAAALDWLRQTPVSLLTDGKHSLDGDLLYAIVQRYRPKGLSEAKWEAHRRFADVQYIAAGEERIGWRALDDGLAILKPYDPQKDVEFFDARGDLLSVRAGHFAVFLPQDVHAPGLAAERGGEEGVLKVVLKCQITGPG